jgi:hypothetical protein
VGLARVSWLVTTVTFVIAALILGLRGDYGYAATTFAVAIAAAINLF